MESNYNLHVGFIKGVYDSYSKMATNVISNIGMFPDVDDENKVKLYIVQLNRKLNEFIGVLLSATLTEKTPTIVIRQSYLIEFVIMPTFPVLFQGTNEQQQLTSLIWMLKVLEGFIVNSEWAVKIEQEQGQKETFYVLSVKSNDIKKG